MKCDNRLIRWYEAHVEASSNDYVTLYARRQQAAKNNSKFYLHIHKAKWVAFFFVRFHSKRCSDDEKKIFLKILLCSHFSK